MRSPSLLLPALGLAAVLSGCATTSTTTTTTGTAGGADTAGSAASAASRNPVDPYERFNRTMFNFNDKVDQYALKPAATV